MTQLQWLGVALIAAGLIWWLVPEAIATLRSWRPTTPSVASEPIATLMDRMARIALLQSDLEARGHTEEAEIAGTWFALMRDPIQQEAPTS